MKKYIDAERLKTEIESIHLFPQRSADYNDGREDMKMMMLDIIDSLQQEPPHDTDALHTELVNLLKTYRIGEETARTMADRIADTYGAQRYMDGLCDGLNEEDTKQSEEENGKFVFPKFLYARTTNNKTIDVSYGPQSLDAVEYVRIDYLQQECIYGRTPKEREKYCKFCSAVCNARVEHEQSDPSNNLVDVDAVREDFITEVYRVLDADPTNDRANAIIDAFDSLPTVSQEHLDFPTTDEQIKEFLATHPKIKVPEKYKNPDWLFKKQEQSEVDLEKEIDFFLYGTYTPERFPNTMQVRDEHTGFRVNDWKFWVNKPEYKVKFARHFYELGRNARKEDL